MNIISLKNLGPFGTDCYILETFNKNAALIDAPYNAGIIIKELSKRELELKKIFLTHGHCDHIEALNGLYEHYKCEVFIHKNDLEMLTSPSASLAEYFGTPFKAFWGAQTVLDGENLVLDDVELEVLHTPGHSAGSVCYIARECVFTGDTLFCGSIGRTDLGGDFDALINSIDRLINKCGRLKAYPGHGEPTEIMNELRTNPYLRDLRASRGEKNNEVDFLRT